MERKLNSTIDIYLHVLERKFVVREKLAQLEHCDCKESPTVPYCLLKTEMGSLNKYLEVLERELFHESSSKTNQVSSTLLCSIEGMVSTDWKERLKAEWVQLCTRMELLDSFRDRFRKDDIDFVPKWDERLLCDQLRAMRMYRDCLLNYAKLEGVDLDMSVYNDDYRYDYYFKKEEK